MDQHNITVCERKYLTYTGDSYVYKSFFCHWWCFDCASIMMVHITGYKVCSIGEEGSMGGRNVYRNWLEDEPDSHVCISYNHVVCVLGLGWVYMTLVKPVFALYIPGSNATEIDCICWYWLQLTLLLMNSISLPACRKSPAVSFFSRFSMLSVFLFVIKLTLPFLLSGILAARIHVERVREGGIGRCDDVLALVCIYQRFSCNFELERNMEWPYIEMPSNSHVMVGLAQACPNHGIDTCIIM